MNIAVVASFAAVGFGLLAAHTVADHWVQTSYQANTKGAAGTEGRLACAAHVASYTVVTSAVVGLLWLALGLHLSPWGYLAGQVISAGSHYWADRRFTLAKLAGRLGKGDFYCLGMPRKVEAQGYTLLSGREVVRLFRPADQLHSSLGEPAISWDNPSLGTGAYALDQAWHHGWLFLAALATVVL
jgi:hypothetical protein